MATKELITAEQLRELLSYDPETGIFTWLVSIGNQVFIGAIAGSSRDDRYVNIKIDKRIYKAHRLAWLYMTGEWPTHEIDHIDLDIRNNRWRNLREATDSQNNSNQGIRRDNTSGAKGVCWDDKRSKWRAFIRIHGRGITIGRFSTKDEACSAYHAAAREYFGEFARTS